MAASISRQNVEVLNPQQLAEPADELTIPSVTLDGFCSRQGLRPDLMKIDVEGAELHVLRGARNVLADSRPLIYCEIHPQQMANCGGSVNELTGLLSETGYDVTPLDAPNPDGIYHARLRHRG